MCMVSLVTSAASIKLTAQQLTKQQKNLKPKENWMARDLLWHDPKHYQHF